MITARLLKRLERIADERAAEARAWRALLRDAKAGRVSGAEMRRLLAVTGEVNESYRSSSRKM